MLIEEFQAEEFLTEDTASPRPDQRMPAEAGSLRLTGVPLASSCFNVGLGVGERTQTHVGCYVPPEPCGCTCALLARPPG